MARRLLLLRHAKSSWGDLSLPDDERPLNGRGQRAATLMGAYIAQQGTQPSRVLCSPALRARQTWERVSPHLGPGLEVQILDALYLATPHEILAELRGLPPSVECALVIGHNPGLEELAVSLANPDNAKGEVASLRNGLPTAGLVDFELPKNAGWQDLAARACRLRDLRVPKQLV